jgi:acetyl esterase/lipase
LVLHGSADHVIPVSEGEALVDRARTLGGQSQLVVYPNADHGFDWEPTSAIANQARARAVDFLRRQLDAK